MTRSLELVNMYSTELNIVGMEDLDALSLTDVEILPHYSRFINKYCDFERKCAEYETLHNKKVIRINDGDAVIITNEKQLIVTAD